jgi:signal transduction histidine kinase
LDQAFAEVPGIHSEMCLREFSSTKLIPFVNSQHGFDVLITVHFADGERTVFHAFLPEGESLLRDAVLIYLCILLIVALLIAGFLIKKTIVPLERLAQAADEIATGTATIKLAEQGPEEISKAARAFNQMQERIQRLLRAQTDMLTAISHDLRSAVTRLHLRTELLANEEERQAMLRVVQDMGSMIQSMLDFVRGQDPSEPLKKVDLHTLVESLCEDMASEGHALTYRSLSSADQNQTWLTMCRPVALRRALQNIIDNALKYGKCAEVSTAIENKHFIITVTDEGPGIPEEQLENVLLPFFRLEKSRNTDTGGIGLGLAIAYNIIREYGGKMQIGNVEKGLRVSLILPEKPSQNRLSLL